MVTRKVFYAVKRGRRIGVYQDWKECWEQVHKFQGAEYQKFDNHTAAASYISGIKPSNDMPHTANDIGLSPSKVDAEFKCNEACVYFDGGSRNNPGPSGCGAIMYSHDKTKISSAYRFLGMSQTNNFAEYHGLLLAINIAKANSITKLKAYSDSKLVVSQINKLWQVRDPNLLVLWTKAIKEIQEFEKFEIHHIMREKNQEADLLTNKGIDLFSQFTTDN